MPRLVISRSEETTGDLLMANLRELANFLNSHPKTSVCLVAHDYEHVENELERLLVGFKRHKRNSFTNEEHGGTLTTIRPLSCNQGHRYDMIIITNHCFRKYGSTSYERWRGWLHELRSRFEKGYDDVIHEMNPYRETNTVIMGSDIF